MQRKLSWVTGVCLAGLTTSAALAANPTLRLDPNSVCFTGNTVTINVVFDQDAPADEILGGQFFLQFNASYLTFSSAVPGEAPFTREVFESVSGNQIDYAVGIPDPPTPPAIGYSGTGPIVMARLNFTVSADICGLADLVEWRTPLAPFQTRLTKRSGAGSAPLLPSSLTDLGAITRDATAPTVTAPSNITVECDAIPAAPTTLAEFLALAGAAASDACSGLSSAIAVSDSGNPPANSCSGSFVRSFTIYDECGNSTVVNQTITLQDTTAPVLTAPVDANIACGGSVPAAPTGRAWGFYSNGGGETNINRPFASPLAVGDTFSFAFDNGWIDNSRSVGFSLRNNSNVIRLELYYVGGNATFTINDAAGFAQTSAIPFGDEGFQFEVRISGADSYTLKATRLEDDSVYYHSGTLASSGSIDRFRAFNGTAGNGPNYDVYANSLRIVNASGTQLAFDNASAAAYDDGLQDGDNGGSGFLAWDRNPDSNDGQRGVFLGSSQGNGNGDSTSDDDIDSFVGVSATDNCDDLPEIWYVGQTTGPVGCTGQAAVVRTWAARDDCGNATQTTQTFTFVDTTPPDVTNGPGNQSLQCASALPAATTNPADFTYTEGCDTTLTVTSADSSNSGAGCAGDPLIITRTYTLTDDCTNFDTWVQVFTIADTTNPTVTAGTIGACYADVAAAEAAAIAATTYNDNCTAHGSLGVAASTTGTCSAVVTVTVTDACGNSNSVNYNTRIDSTDPTVTAGSIGACYPTAAAAEAAAITATTYGDDCTAHGSLGVVASTLGTCSAVVTVTVTDECGNDASVAYNTRIDNTPPTATSSGGIASCYTSQAVAEAAAVANSSAIDDCPGALTPIVSTTGTCTATIKVKFQDACGNQSNELSYSTSIDAGGPAATSAGPIAGCHLTEAAAVAAALANSSAIDDCTPTPTPSTSVSYAGCVATISVWYTDACGNPSNTLQYSSTVDGAAPTLSGCPSGPITVPGDASCNGVVPNVLGGVSASDACDTSPTITQSPTAGSSFTGSVVVTITAADDCGNSSTCTVTVAVIDATPPTISCPSGINADTDAGVCTASVSFAATAGDNCGTPTITYHLGSLGGPVITSPHDFPIGASTVYAIASDGLNSASCSFTVTVTDAQAPTISCPAHQSRNAGVSCQYVLEDFTGLAEASDNCGTPAVTQSPAPGTALGLGSHTITLTATDGASLQASCTFPVTVSDTIPPSITCPTDQSRSAGASCQYVLEDFTGMATASDNCGTLALMQSPLPGAVLGLGAHTITLVASDGLNPPATCTLTVTVGDATPPSITCPTNQSRSAGASCQYVLENFTGLATASDNCGTPAVTQSPVPGTLLGLGLHTITLTATDGASLTADCTFTVTVSDTTDPVISGCPGNISVNAAADSCSAVVTWTPPTALDNCDSNLTVTSTHNPGDTFPSGTTTVTYTFTDDANNSATCAFDVVVGNQNAFEIDVQLQGSIADPSVAAGDTFTRCIRFEFNCSSGAPAYAQNVLVTFSSDAGVGNGRSIAGQTITIPCGNYICVSAEDELHTLRRTLTPGVSSGAWVASFTGVDELAQGDLYDDNLVDIAEFGTYIAAWGWTGSRSTHCSTSSPHADLNADGAIGAADFAFIQSNFLALGDYDCCGGFALGAARPRVSIPARQFGRYGLPVWVDLTNDGVLDTNDAIAFINGARPNLRRADGSGIAPSVKPTESDTTIGGGSSDPLEVDPSGAIGQ